MSNLNKKIPVSPHAFCPQVEQVNFVLLLGPLRSSGRRALSRSTGPERPAVAAPARQARK